MSLDLSLITPACNLCGQYETKASFNYTYNVSRMWYAIYPEDEGMVSIEGMTGEDASKKIQAAILEMKRKQKFMETLNPANGWGSYTGFLCFLQEIYNACLDCPECIWMAYR